MPKLITKDLQSHPMQGTRINKMTNEKYDELSVKADEQIRSNNQRYESVKQSIRYDLIT